MLSYSGTGLLALVIGLLVPMNGRNLLRVLGVAAVAGALFLLLAEPLNLSFTLARLDEFDSQRSSAYIRYIAPARLVAETAAQSPWLLWFGQGPGTISPGGRLRVPRPDLGEADHRIRHRRAHRLRHPFPRGAARTGGAAAVRAMLFGGWLVMGGHLLSPEQNFMTLALVGLLPAEAPRAAEGAPARGAPFPWLGARLRAGEART